MRFSQPTNLNISMTWFLFNLVATHVLHLWSPITRSSLKITNRSFRFCCTLSMEWTRHWSPRASSDTVSCTFSYHTWQFVIFAIVGHYHRLRLASSLTRSVFHSELKLSSSANPFIHRPFPFLPDWLHGLSDHLTILLCSAAGLVSVL